MPVAIYNIDAINFFSFPDVGMVPILVAFAFRGTAMQLTAIWGLCLMLTTLLPGWGVGRWATRNSWTQKKAQWAAFGTAFVFWFCWGSVMENVQGGFVFAGASVWVRHLARCAEILAIGGAGYLADSMVRRRA